MTGIPLNGKTVDLEQLHGELQAAGLTTPGLGTAGDNLFTYDASGTAIDLPAAAAAVVTAHTPSTALKDQLVSRLQATVGVAMTDLTNAQLLAIIGGLLHKQGGLNRQGQVRPLNQWLL